MSTSTKKQSITHAISRTGSYVINVTYGVAYGTYRTGTYFSKPGLRTLRT